MGWYGMDWIDLTKVKTSGGLFVNTVMNLWVP
jgi:hypothetical protein